MLTAAHSKSQPLSQWLRLLWDAAPTLHLDSEAPFIASGGIHLPARERWQQHCAAAAHAAAHLIYSPQRFEADGLVPTARALLALLEDARVEVLAMRELPGLARLWRPLHTATPDSGNGCEPLMARLARALTDPAYVDPHPWVAKGRRLFYLDERLSVPALCSPAALRTAALWLGHDIGQLRLPFNAKGYRPAPAYRDDHRWMWAADQLAEVQPPPAPRPTPADALRTPEGAEPAGAETISHQPEWDRLIQRLRPDWCRVIEQAPAPTASHLAHDDEAEHANTQQISRRLLAPLRGLMRPMAPRGRSAEGEAFHLDALIDWQTARRTGLAADGRVFRARQRQAARAGVWLLVDRSASTAAPLTSQPSSGTPPAPSTEVTTLQLAGRTAHVAALALQALGLHCAVSAFSSSGRHAVRLHTLKTFGQPADDQLLQRLQALRPGGSTRLGAALRHATARLGAGRGSARWVLLISDGQPHDVDAHDPRYLVDDARQAVQDAGRRGVRLACLTLTGRAGPEALRIFGRRGAQALVDLNALPRALRRLMA